jgi:hypothetical protein
MIAKVPSAVSRTPKNRNYLNPLNFRFTIMRAPHVEFFIQTANVPGINLPAVDQPTPFVKIPRPGEHLDFEELRIGFKVDENLRNYEEIRKWMFALGKPTDFRQYAEIEEEPIWTGKGITSDVSLMILSGTKSPNYEVVFTDAWPTGLSDLRFESTDEDIPYIACDASFKYTVFEIKKTN